MTQNNDIITNEVVKKLPYLVLTSVLGFIIYFLWTFQDSNYYSWIKYSCVGATFLTLISSFWVIYDRNKRISKRIKRNI